MAKHSRLLPRQPAGGNVLPTPAGAPAPREYTATETAIMHRLPNFGKKAIHVTIVMEGKKFPPLWPTAAPLARKITATAEETVIVGAKEVQEFSAPAIPVATSSKTTPLFPNNGGTPETPTAKSAQIMLQRWFPIAPPAVPPATLPNRLLPINPSPAVPICQTSSSQAA